MSSTDSATQEKVTRRRFLKWTTALAVAGAAVVGIGAGYGSDLLLRPATEKTVASTQTKTETVTKSGTATVTQSGQNVTQTVTQTGQTVTATKTVTAPPQTISYVPPLSADVQARVDTAINQLTALHSGESIAYTYCTANGCAMGGSGPCLLETHVKNGVVTAIDVGDNINVNNPREDVGLANIKLEMIQARPCVRGRAWRKTIYAPDRLLYPMKSVGARGERKFVRTTWDDAISTVVSQMKATIAKRGNYSCMGSGPNSVLPYMGDYSFRTWGMSSYSGHQLADMVTLGVSDWGMVSDSYGHEVLDLFNCKLFIAFGMNPAVTMYGTNYFLTLAHEQGTKIILIDPALTLSAKTHADQWIPIRPGTDAAMMLAIADVIFKESLWDQNYVQKFVEPTGFQKWKDYVTGVEDGTEKTPEWAEQICGVPAETIRALARLYAATKPAHLRLYWSASRKFMGENQARMGAYLQAMTGNVGISGGGIAFDFGANYGATSAPTMSFPKTAGKYPVQVVVYDRAWMDAMILKPKLDSGAMSLDEYQRRIGAAKGWPVPNIGYIWYSVSDTPGRHSLGTHDQNKVIQAFKLADFVVSPMYHITNPGCFWADILLPLADPHFEDYHGFARGGAYTNYFVCGFKVVQPPGECKPYEWINIQVAKGFGVEQQYNPTLAATLTDPAAYDAAYETALKNAYTTWAATAAVKPLNPPTWDDFKKRPVWRVPHTDPAWFGFWDKIQQGNAFDTTSGKMEFYSSFIADPNMAQKSFTFPQRKIDNKVCVGGGIPPQIPPIAKWMPAPTGFMSPDVAKYPLTMITSHSIFRQHVSQDNNAWFRDEGRHACWLSVPDATARGISDGDQVRVFNTKGEIIMPAYVTSRLTPGVTVVRYGAWYEPSGMKTTLMPDGIDTRGASNFLTTSEDYPWPAGPLHAENLVEVVKFTGGVQ